MFALETSPTGLQVNSIFYMGLGGMEEKNCYVKL